jgi:hypothetical protein
MTVKEMGLPGRLGGPYHSCSRWRGAVGGTTMQEYRYAQQKLWEAIYALVGDGPIRDRLGYALTTLIVLRPEHDIPDHLRDKFSTLMADLTKRAITYSYRSTRVNTRRPKSGYMARTILELYTSLRGGISD